MSLAAAVCALSFAAWLYLAFAHGRYWLGDQRLDGRAPAPAAWPAVVAVVPARDEAALLPETLASLLEQDYPGEFRVVLVDDESADGTADVAARIAEEHPNGARLAVAHAPPRPPGWVGKMWAVETGVRAGAGDHAFWLFTDADVAHGPDDLRRLVAKAEADRLDLVSQMVLLHAGSGWGALLVPAFVYFFQKLYPFPRVNDPRARTAAAAGGCVLVRREALARAGGIEALRGEVIDDCALGRAVKRGGPIWLGLSTSERSVRPCAGIGDVWRMVARSAYTQLHCSPSLLVGTLAGLVLLYGVPPLALLGWPWHGDAAAGALGAAAWALQAATFVPTLALYGRAPVWALALPVAGALYAAMTIDSARRHRAARGATWKGRPGAGAHPHPDPRGGRRRFPDPGRSPGPEGVGVAGEGKRAAEAAPMRLVAPPWRLVPAAIGGPRAVAGNVARLAHTVRVWLDRGEIRRRLRALAASGHLREQPTPWQIFFGGLDMLRFVIEPAARDYYRQKGISFGFHQLLRVLDDPVSMIDPTGFLSERDTIIGHVMQVVHLNPVYDLQLLEMFPDGLDELERQVQAMIDGTHPRAGTIGAIVEDPGYHARLLAYVRRYRQDPTTPPPVREEQTLRADPRFAAAERTFATLPGFVAYCAKLPDRPFALLRRLREVRAFPLELAGP